MSAAALPQPGRTMPAGLGSLVRSLVINLAGPWAVYSVAAPHFAAQSTAPLLLSALVPLVEFAVIYTRQRTVDVIAIISLVQLAAGIAVILFAHTVMAGLAGHALMPAMLGLVFGASLPLGRPLIQPLARQTMAGNDPERQARFDLVARKPGAQRVFRQITLVWAVTLCVQSAVQLIAVRHMTAAAYLIFAPVLGYGLIGLLIWGAIRFGRRAAARATD